MNRRTITANAVVVGATGDCSSKNGNWVGERVREGQNRHANADGGGGAAVYTQDDVSGAGRHRHLALKVPDFAIPVPLHLGFWW